MVKISAVVITKNAEKYLEKCLRSIKPLVDEVVLMDSGSSDKTIAIAKELGAKVFKQKWLGFARQKNLAIAKTKNNWILSIDADEVIDHQLVGAIKKASFSQSDGFYVNRKNFYADHWVRHCGWYPDWQLRIFKKSAMKFEEREVHEAVLPKGKIGYLQGHFIHYTYANDHEYFLKIDRYTSLDAKILYLKKRKWTIFYQLAKPIKEFLHLYVGKYGFKDGGLGLKICLYSAYYRWVAAKKLKKFWEKNKV